MTTTHLTSRFNARGASSLTSHTPLTDAQIRAVAPSVFAEDKAPSRSARYTYIPTIDILAGLRREGFQPFTAVQTRAKAENREFTKHLLRLRHVGGTRAEGVANEIILVNSHNGASSYQMIAGAFRFVCMNGLVTGDIVDEVKVRHTGNIIDNVVEGAHNILGQFRKVDEHRTAMQGTQLNEQQRLAFARAAMYLRWGEEATDANVIDAHAPALAAPVTERQVLQPRRFEDQANDLWTTFNRVQENVVRGGLRGRSANNRRMSTREVTGIDQQVKLNRALWILAENMREMVAA
jgi:hypothetical protein